MWVINHYYNKFTESILSIVVLLAMRVVLFDIFFTSGWQNIQDWEITLTLFENEFPLPLLSPEIAAYSATIIQLVFPVLILIGFGTRWAALPLLMMAVVIQTFVIQNPDHFFWMMLAGALMCFGAGKASIDYGLCRWLRWQEDQPYK